MAEPRELRIEVPLLARVEGEGALEVTIRDGRISDLALHIFEPPRLFEKLLEGRDFHEVPDIVARICGICPVAYQMSAVHALEALFGVQTNDWIRDLRRVMYCGEWIESHALHIHLLALPDFLGYPDAVAMARDHPDALKRGLRLQALGNELIRLLGGRSVHPVGVKVGGFHQAPAEQDVARLCEKLRAALPDAGALVAWTARLDLREERQSFTSVALRHAVDYPMNEGRIASSEGLSVPASEYEQHFTEHQVSHSTALHSRLLGRPYLVGPLARLNLNRDRLPSDSVAMLASTGIQWPSASAFHNIVARALEIHFALAEAVRLLERYRRPVSPEVPVQPCAGSACAATEAPRGLLWHRYETDDAGRILRARIVPPTSQNQARIEEDLRLSLEEFGLDRPEDELRRHGEQIIRNYDPCISCATHFLRLRVNRG